MAPEIPSMRRIVPFVVTALVVIAGVVYSQRTRVQMVGPLEGGGTLLNSGWRIRPAGKNIPLSTLPMSYVPAPDGRMIAVLNGGYQPPSVSLLDMETVSESSRVEIGDGWRGLAFSRAGDKLYAGNGGKRFAIGIGGPREIP